MIAGIQGRMVRFRVLEQTNINLQAAEFEQLVEILSVTDKQELRVLEAIVGKEKCDAHVKAMRGTLH